MKVRWLALLPLFLGACAAGPTGSALDGEGANLGELQLNQPLAVPAHRGEVYFQGGQIYHSPGFLSLQAVDQYYPHCRLELRKAMNQTLELRPDRFRVVRVTHDQAFVQRGPVLVAALELQLAIGAGPVIASTTFYLYSDQQPQVWRLRCAHWEDPWDARYPTIAQIQTALGEVLTLHPPH